MRGKDITDGINTPKSRMGDQAHGILVNKGNMGLQCAGICEKKNDVSDFCMKEYTETTLYDNGEFSQRKVKSPY
jgi:hypothetical protein